MTKIFDAELLTTHELGRRLGVTRMTICRAVKEGRLRPAAKLPGANGAYLFAPSAVDEWRGPRLFEIDGHMVFGVSGPSFFAS